MKPRATPPLEAKKARFNAERGWSLLVVVGRGWSLLVGGVEFVRRWSQPSHQVVGHCWSVEAVELESGEVASRREVASKLRNGPSDRAPSRSSDAEE